MEKTRTIFGTIINVVRGLLTAASFYLVSWIVSWVISFTKITLDNPTQRIICFGLWAVIMAAVTLLSKQNFKNYFRFSIEGKEGEKKSGLRTGLISVLSFVFGVSLNRMITLLVNVLPLSSDVVSAEEESTAAAATGNIWVVIIATWIVAPVVEELIFRGKAYKYFEDAGNRIIAVIVTSLVFGIAHGNILQGSYAVVMALFCCMVTVMGGNIIPAICLHIGFNASNLLLATIFGSSETLVMPVNIVLGILLVSSFVGIMLIRDVFMPEKVKAPSDGSIYINKE